MFKSNNRQPIDEEFYTNFWTDFRSHLAKKKSSLKPFEETFNFSRGGDFTYCGVNFGEIDSNDVRLFGWTFVGDRRIAAKIRFLENVSLFNRLKADSASIETHFEDPLVWDERPAHSVGFYKENVNFRGRANQRKLFEWLREHLEQLDTVFAQKLALYCLQDHSKR